ncbi:MAG: hypothetical protein NUW01_16330, partial [Gemmatimonadaceae bacterium]|nr:hypothetical protein [Gemmatimonadaceae bacterium]
FIPLSEHRKGDEPLFQIVAAQIVERARRVLLVDTETRDTAKSMSSLIAAAANLKAARTNNRLQVAAILVALTAVLLALAPERADEVQNWIRALTR